MALMQKNCFYQTFHDFCGFCPHYNCVCTRCILNNYEQYIALVLLHVVTFRHFVFLLSSLLVNIHNMTSMRTNYDVLKPVTTCFIKFLYKTSHRKKAIKRVELLQLDYQFDFESNCEIISN